MPNSNKKHDNNIPFSFSGITATKTSFLSKLIIIYKLVIIGLRLALFAIILLPAFLQIAKYWVFDGNIRRNIRYGKHNRNVLDIYMAPSSLNAHNDDKNKRPVVVFLSGGAWMIGHKAWGALMGKIMSHDHGIVFVTPDYRNYPQGTISDMVQDADEAIQWIYQNIQDYNGDCDNITLICQSAGAHISACLLMETLKNNHQPCDKNAFDYSKLNAFIGISGTYNIARSMPALEEKGLHSSIIKHIMNHDVLYYSPSIQLRQMITLLEEEQPQTRIKNSMRCCLPPIHLFHGTADKSIHWNSTQEFYELLLLYYSTTTTTPGNNSRQSNDANVHVKYYMNKSHTDLIIEDPIQGDNNHDFIYDILNVIYSDATNDNDRASSCHLPSRRKSLVPFCFIQLARKVNPF